jgi:hypothetical protein
MSITNVKAPLFETEGKDYIFNSILKDLQNKFNLQNVITFIVNVSEFLD